MYSIFIVRILFKLTLGEFALVLVFDDSAWFGLFYAGIQIGHAEKIRIFYKTPLIWIHRWKLLISNPWTSGQSTKQLSSSRSAIDCL
jgi:hypothetical protein